MSLFVRFRIHYLHYLISIIIPALITALSILLFKRILGAADYGHFAILFNSLLLVTATLTGWISQSVIRFYPASNNRPQFFRYALQLTGRSLLVAAVPCWIIVYWFYTDVLLALCAVGALCAASCQFTLVALGQSVFISRKSILSEMIRSVTYLVLALLLLQYSSLDYQYSLLLSVTAAYGLSAWYLYRQVRNHIPEAGSNNEEAVPFREFVSGFMRYGVPLSLWFIGAYLITLVDKLFMRQWISGEAQGNYQAMFDLISRTISLLISPVILAMYPLLTHAYEKGERTAIRKLLRNILLLEAAAMLLTMAGYWIFGAGWLFALVHTPEARDYKTAGLLIIAGTFIWQMAVVVQKKFELRYLSTRLLILLVTAFSLQLLLYYLAGRSGNLLVFPAGYLLASLSYLLLLLIPIRR